MKKYLCQMSIGSDFISGRYERIPCDRPAKFKNPKVQMGIEYVCGIHASSLNKMYKRINQNIECVPLP